MRLRGLSQVQGEGNRLGGVMSSLYPLTPIEPDRLTGK